MNGITAAQLRKIHVLSRERGLDDDTLHAFVHTVTKKDSLKKLTIVEAIKVIDSMEGGEAAPAGMVTAKQQKYILGLAKEIGWVDEMGKPDENRLQGFIRERFKVHHIKWLSSAKASQIIEALKAMKERQKKEAVI